MKANIVEFPDKNALQEEAAFWLIKLDADEELSPESLAALQEWLARSPAHRQELRKLADTWRRMNVLTELTVPLGRMDPVRPAFSWRFFQAWRPGFRTGAVLASLLFSIGIYLNVAGWWSLSGYTSTNGVYATRIGEQRVAVLADGSVIRLNTNSEIQVDFSDGFRDIRLVRGEAEFAVAKDPEHPFRVYARNQRVQAVGTAFTVYLQRDKIDVMVTEGEVTLATRAGAPARDEIAATLAPAPLEPAAPAYVETVNALKAGQSATMSPDAYALDAANVAVEVEVLEEPGEMDRRLSWREGLLIFDGDPLEDVVREISRYTTVVIEITDPQVRATKIGGQFPVGKTDAMFDVLESSFGFTITRLDDGRVLISPAAD